MLTVKAGFQDYLTHRWPTAPKDSILKYPHQHLFKVLVELEVGHANREVEFFTLGQCLKRRWEDFKDSSRGKEIPCVPLSCEDLALALVGDLKALYPGRYVRVTVMEDEYHGASAEFLGGATCCDLRANVKCKRS